MGHEDIITMSVKELEKLEVIADVTKKRISQKNASKRLNLSVRQIKRLVKRFRVFYSPKSRLKFQYLKVYYRYLIYYFN